MRHRFLSVDSRFVVCYIIVMNPEEHIPPEAEDEIENKKKKKRKTLIVIFIIIIVLIMICGLALFLFIEFWKAFFSAVVPVVVKGLLDAFFKAISG